MEFEWHEAKAEANLQSHGVSFELAKTVFKDPFAIELLDDREDYGEERVRIISARRATQDEQDDYFKQSA
ncbi:MAG: BrnT family toxin [Bryobacteraceae bacterium]